MGSKKKTLHDRLTDVERIEFVKQLEEFYEVSYADLRKVLTFSFLKGVATGFGALVGGTIVVALILWILSGLNSLPFVGKLSEAAQHSIQKPK